MATVKRRGNGERDSTRSRSSIGTGTPAEHRRHFGTPWYLYSVRSVQLTGVATPWSVGVCAGTPGTRRPNRRAAAAAHAVPGRWSGRRSRFWVQPLQGHKGVGGRHQRHVVVPALEGAALEVVQPQRVLQFAVIVLHSPAQLGQT